MGQGDLEDAEVEPEATDDHQQRHPEDDRGEDDGQGDRLLDHGLAAELQAARPCNNSIYGDVLPQIQRTNVMMKATQDFFGGRLTVSETVAYNDLHTFQQTGPGTISAVNVYGAGSGKGGQINPFFLAPAGAPGTNTEQVSPGGICPTASVTKNNVRRRFSR